jgi:hypothetical protein
MQRVRLPLLIACVLALCGCAGTTTTPGPTGRHSTGPSPTRDPSTIDHPTGATDVVLRFEEGGGFVPIDFIATQAPAFTLYGDGTVVFRNTSESPPEPSDGVARSVPFCTARLSEEQIQALLDRAINRGALGIAKPHYDPGTVADAPTATFTLNAGSIKKTVSVVALGFETPPGVDMLTLAALAELGKLLRDFDANSSSGASPYQPTGYRAQLWDAGAQPANPPRAWPWPDLEPSDFRAPEDEPGSPFLRRALSTDEVSALELSGLEGGAQGLFLKGPDDKIYTLALRPLLPDERG